MGQQEVISCLKKRGIPLSAREIAEELKMEIKTVHKILSTLVKFNEIISFEINRIQAQLLYNPNIKRRMSLYYYPNSN